MAKKIVLKNLKITVVKGTDPIPFVYADILQTILKQQPQGGFGFDDMSKCLKIVNKLEALKEGVESFLTLEEVDYEYLKVKVLAFRWGYAHDELLVFRDAIVNAETVEI